MDFYLIASVMCFAMAAAMTVLLIWGVCFGSLRKPVTLRALLERRAKRVGEFSARLRTVERWPKRSKVFPLGFLPLFFLCLLPLSAWAQSNVAGYYDPNGVFHAWFTPPAQWIPYMYKIGGFFGFLSTFSFLLLLIIPKAAPGSTMEKVVNFFRLFLQSLPQKHVQPALPTPASTTTATTK